MKISQKVLGELLFDSHCRSGHVIEFNVA